MKTDADQPSSQLTAPVPASVSADLRSATESARSFAAESKADATRRAYRSDWRCFKDWCRARGLAALPATGETVTLYIADRAAPPDASKPLAVATLERRLAAISQAHRLAGLASPASTREEPLHSVWTGLVRTRGRAQHKVDPALTADVLAMLEALPRTELPGGGWAFTTASLRDRCLLVVGFAGALRRSEVAALAMADLSIGLDGLRVRLPRSKTDQQGVGAVLGLHRGERPLSCPVRAVQDWMRHSAITEGPLLRSVNRHGGRRIVCLGRRIRRTHRPTLCGTRWPRRGGVLGPLAQGRVCHPSRPRRCPRARHHAPHAPQERETLRGYIRDGQLFDQNPTGSLGL